MMNGKNKDMVKEFHEAVDQPMGIEVFKGPASNQILMLRAALISEESKEVLEAINAWWSTVWKTNNKASYILHKEKLLKELMDLIYVIEGMCVTYGMDSKEAFKRVHESNMSKLVDGKPYKNKKGKVEKGPNYKEPSMEGLV